MKNFTIEGKLGDSEVTVGPANAFEKIGERQTVVITDENVEKIHEVPVAGATVIAIEAGEGAKSLDTARSVYLRLLKHEFDRRGFVVGFGGGAVCDLAGFVASTYLRGLDFGFIPTTLLAQVDAAIGGKNGINLAGYKNLVGTFTQPGFVICNVEYLKTLPEDEIRWGLAEALKTGAIGDAKLFELIESNADKLLACDTALMEELVERSAAVKVRVVNEDEREAGTRRLLNFGHTFGHAVEKVASVPHGAAVATGMIVAAELSAEMGFIDRTEADRLSSLVARLGLAKGSDIDVAAAVDAIGKDKKRYGNSIEFVLLNGIGSATTETITLDKLAEVANDMHKHL